MPLFGWAIVFVIALFALVKGADWLLEASEKIGLASGLSPFIVGVIITGVGTSFPELVSSVAAVWQGVPEVVVANAVGSNIANILLIVGISAIIGKRLVVTKNLIDLDLPLLAASTALFLGTVWDAHVSRGEAFMLLAGYVVYLGYSFKQEEYVDPTAVTTEDIIPRAPFWKRIGKQSLEGQPPSVTPGDLVRLFLGFVALSLGAKYLIDSVVAVSGGLGIAVGVISVVAVAFGTSLPELLISAKAAWRKKSEIALGNIFGSNVFNILVVVGVPGAMGALPVDRPTYLVGLPVVVVATVLFTISGISKRIHMWEGMLYMLIYLLFVSKVFSA